MSFSAYPEYKDSGVEWLGEVPIHWVLTPIKHLASLNPRKSGFDGDTQQLCSFVPMEKLKTGVVQLDEERCIEEVIGGYTYFEDGDVLQAKVTPCFENKNVAIAKGLTNGIGFGSSEINVLRPYLGVSPGYLYYRVQEDTYMSFCTSSMIGAGGLKRVPTEVINNFTVAAPEFFEQTQIAHFLDYETARIDALIEEQQRLIELLKEKRQAVISHAVTKGLDPAVPMKDSGAEWLGEVPSHWTATKLKFITNHVVDCPHETPIYDPDGNYLVIRTADLNQGILKSEQMYRLEHDEYIHRTRRMTLEKNDIVYSREGERWGHAALIPESNLYALGQRMMQLRVSNSICPNFFMYQLNSLTTYRQGEVDTVGATAPHVNISTVINYCVMRPPKDEQVQISQYLSKTLSSLDCLIGESLEMKELLQERRSALISAAVTGKIDVRGWQPPANATSPELAQEAV
ncbi:restriction endonuclease subunit S [Pseudomonas chlororaphis]|uniref:restriction endonuclease subunit S n=1 Tax=Pseudomonas chlororaphis TaxID=587753 RepID=UPI0004AC05FE|nr:restriction endonuclease subunit S [Pseudomonas chlororaphis]AIC19521.1 hypothetical protein EY04_11620 [Pseudomonas chlororaphis]AZE22938.1 Type I restriction-modification system, specificity subunit S [Pseudomonas chlororaphis subsp. aureofaciens]